MFYVIQVPIVASVFKSGGISNRITNIAVLGFNVLMFKCSVLLRSVVDTAIQKR